MNKKMVVLGCSCWVFALSGYAAQAIDAQVSGALDDLAKYESQAASLAPGQTRQINNILRFLPLTESRLASSSHKSDPSWVDANNRLLALKQRLDDLAAGKSATVSPAAAAGAQDDRSLLSRYQSESNQLSNDMRTTATAQYANGDVINGFQQRLDGLKALSSQVKEPNNRAQLEKNAASLQTWLNQAVANVGQQASQHQQQAQARQADAAQRQQQQEGARQAATAEEARRQDDFAAREAARQQRNSDRVAANAALRASSDTPTPSAGGQDDATTHQQFGRAYQDVRVSLQYLKAAELNEPREAAYWKRKLAAFDTIVANFQDKTRPDVAEDLRIYTEMKSKLDGLFAGSQKTDATNYANYAADVDALKGLAEKYAHSAVFTREGAPRAKTLRSEFEQDHKNVAQLHQTYDAFLAGNTSANGASINEANEMRRRFTRAEENMAAFDRAQKDFFADLGPTFNKHLKKAESLMKEAVSNKHMEYFSNGAIDLQLDKAGEQLSIYQTVAGGVDNAYDGYHRQLQGLTKQVRETEASLATQIVNDRKVPLDRYKGPDREQALSLTLAAFKKVFPGKKILANGVYGNNWERQTRTEWDGTAWVKSDYSTLGVWIIADKGDDRATIYSSNVFKNHMKGDAVTAYGFKADAPGRDMLKSHLN